MARLQWERHRQVLFLKKPVILVENLSGKQRCPFESSQHEEGIKSRSPPLWASLLDAEKQGNFCPFEGQLQHLLCFSGHSFLLLGVSYAKDARGCLRKARFEIEFELRHVREATSPVEIAAGSRLSCALGALKRDGQTRHGRWHSGSQTWHGDPCLFLNPVRGALVPWWFHLGQPA